MPLEPTVNGIKTEAPSTSSERDLAVNEMKKIFGSSGTREYGGFFMDEYLTEWRDEKRVDTVEEMRRSDASVKSALRAIKVPILATEWSVTTKGTDPLDEEIREFVEKNLFKNMKRSWKDFLREALAYLDFGHYAFEIIWEMRDGKVCLADLAPRIPRSIYRWKLDNGEFGIVQLLQDDKTKTTSMPQIPGKKLLILTNDKEGDDVTGQSVLRAAYKHYVYKDILYKIQGISSERFGMGIPTITLGEGTGVADKAKAEEMGKNMRANETGFVVLMNGMTFEIKTPQGNPLGAAIEEGIQHHSRQIQIAVLANFLSLGDSGGGSLALSKDKSSFFLEFVEDACTYLTEQVDKQVIKGLVDVNYGEREHYPELDFTPLGDIDYKLLAETFAVLANAGLFEVDARVKQHIHKTFSIPEIPEEKMDLLEEQEMEIALTTLETGKKPEVVPPNGANPAIPGPGATPANSDRLPAKT